MVVFLRSQVFTLAEHAWLRKKKADYAYALAHLLNLFFFLFFVLPGTRW